MPKRRSTGFCRGLQIVVIVILTNAIGVNSNTVVDDNLEEGRLLIQGLYRNFSTASTSSTSQQAAVSSPVDLVFVLDRSASVTESGWRSMLRFVQNFLEHFTVDEDNTRVAVVSYGTRATIDINGIRNGHLNKCILAAKIQSHMSRKVPSGYSSTYDALILAKNIVLESRADAKKAVIVITDGKSNIGPPPVRASIQLRSLVWVKGWNTTSEGPQLQVYAFGIKDAYMPEVRSMASPMPNHTFYIPSFKAFAELARSLHDDNQSENWKKLSNLELCNGLCDKNAYCTCGTRSGQYLCVCKDGYQGDGMNCTACPRGSYKNTISPSRCTICPSNSTTSKPGATDAKQCVCESPLYQGASGQTCELRYCTDLPDTEHGHKFHVLGKVFDELPDTGIPCKNLPDSSCHFRCETGYRIDGHPGLVCHANGSWEGTVPSCQVVDCGTLHLHQQKDEHSNVTYINQTTTYGSVVHVECHQGWRSFGDTERVCNQYGTWSGTRTWCVENHCPALPLAPGLIIIPPSCGRSVQVPKAICQYVCQPGYELTGPSQVVCTDHGKWGANTSTVCIDREPPSITCPADFTTPVTTANYAVIHTKSYPPVVQDNSGEFILTRVGVADSDVLLHLTIGVHHVRYTARDKAGNEASCAQNIVVIDFTVHLVTCPVEDLTINMTSHQQEMVWPEVLFADHNNVTFPHLCVPENNTLLPPGKYTVSCVPDTPTYQQARCQFIANLIQPKCDIPPAPLNGGLNCSQTETSIQTCTPHCNKNYDFHNLPQETYICDLNGKWNLRYRGRFWPGCSRQYHPHKVVLLGHAKYIYDKGNCEHVKDEIATKFAEFLQNRTRELCGNEACSIGDVSVRCGSTSKRRRRNADVLVTAADYHYQSDQRRRNAEVLVTAADYHYQSDQRHHYAQQETIHYKMRAMGTTTAELKKCTKTENLMNRKHSRIVNPTKKSHIKIMIANKSLKNHSRNRKSEAIKIYKPQFTDSIRDLEQKKLNGKINRSNSLKSGRKIFDENSYMTDDVVYKQNIKDDDNPKRFADYNFIQNQDGAGFKNADKVKERTGCYNCSLSEQNSVFSDNLESVILKRLRKSVTEDYSDADNIGEGVEYSNDPNDSLPGYEQYEDIGQDEVEITFLIYKEYLNESSDVLEQDRIINTLMHLYENLDESLSSQNLSLDDFNITDVGPSSNYTMRNDSNVLYPKGTVLDMPTFDACDVGYVTHEENVFSQMISCVACPAGSHYANDNQCETCQLGYYQPEEAQQSCLPCPNNTVTQYLGADNRSLCLEECNPGEYSGTGLAPCLLCPLHHFQPKASATTCIPCPKGSKTMKLGVASIFDCLDLCNPGTYNVNGTLPCTPCPLRAYQADRGATECLLCQDGLTTLTEGATSISECTQWDACSTTDLVCQNGGHCVAENNVASCVCLSAFSGVSCEINVPDCYSSSCQNNGTCIDGINNFSCSCLPGFTGSKCDVNIDECSSSPCVNGGSCLDLVNGFKCFCLHDFTGVICETRVPQCDRNVCVRGSCEVRNGAMSCVCSQGYAGPTCNVSYDLCSTHPCFNAEECVSTPGHFHCRCLPGFSGALCDVVADPCASSNCSRASTCIPALSSHLGYLCKCRGGWSGQFCDAETPPDFDLVFKADAQDGQYVVLPPEFIPNLQNFTLCAWLRPQPLSAFATIVTFTLPQPPLTSQGNNYHVDIKKEEYEALFSVRHTDTIVVNIFDYSFSTNVTLISYAWSHLCVSLSSSTSHWQVMVNGSLSAQGNVGRSRLSLPAHFSVVIGQSNPYYAENSMQWDVYTGEITQFNIFSSILSLDDVRRLANERTCNKTFGDVISWTDVISYNKGDLIFQEYSRCLDINECWFPVDFPCGNNRACIDLLGSYNCSSCTYGYTGSNCAEPDDECQMEVCSGGDCRDGPEPYDYQCFCPPQFTGEHCEVTVTLCLSEPCQNGGTCVLDADSSFYCICPAQNMGPFCERLITSCFPNPCQNNGVCTNNSSDDYTCSCGDHFTGRLCERHKQWCNDHKCYNGGVCRNVSAHPQDVAFYPRDESFCQCINGWSGRQCEVKAVLTCDLSPCVNGGTCLPLADSDQGYRCQCPYIKNAKLDENCEYVNPCEYSPCANNTLCVLLPNRTFICVCEGGHICDQENDTISNSGTQYGTLSSAWIWSISVGVAILVILAISVAFCILRQRKSQSMDESARGPLTNPGFHSEELQMEESIYAELGDDYTLPQEGSVTESHHSLEPGARSTGSQRVSSRSMSASPSSSLSSLRSALSRKAMAVDDSSKPLLSSDYLEPFTSEVTQSDNTHQIDREIDNAVTPGPGVTNAGFDLTNYHVSESFSQEKNMCKSIIEREGHKNANEDRYPNSASVVTVSKDAMPNKSTSDKINPQKSLESVQNPGYIPIREINADDKFSVTVSHDRPNNFQNSYNNVRGSKQENVGEMNKSTGEPNVPSADVFNIEHNHDSISLTNRTHSKSHEDMNQSAVSTETDKGSLPMNQFGFKVHKLQSPSVFSLNTVGDKNKSPYTDDHHGPKLDTFIPEADLPRAKELSHKQQSDNPIHGSIPEHVECLPTDKIVLSLPKLSLSAQRHKPLLQSSTIKPAGFGDTLSASDQSLSDVNSRYLSYSELSPTSSAGTVASQSTSPLQEASPAQTSLSSTRSTTSHEQTANTALVLEDFSHKISSARDKRKK